MKREWPSGFQGDLSGRNWIHPLEAQPRQVVLVNQLGEPLAFCSVMHKEMPTPAGILKINGLSGVLVFPEARGLGLGFKLISAAELEMAAEDADLSLFSCAWDLCPFYEKIGFAPQRDIQVRIGELEAPVVDHEPLMAKIRTYKGELALEHWKEHPLYFGPYGW